MKKQYKPAKTEAADNISLNTRNYLIDNKMK